MKKLLLAVVFGLVSQLGFSQDKATREDVIQVIEKSGALGQIDAAKKQVLEMIPADKKAAFAVEFDIIIKKATDSTIDIYIQEYTKEDVKAILAFYNSPVGKKMSEKASVIAQKSQDSMMSLQGEVQALVMKYMQ
ncbi:DUF2059 domain-containing protein [Flavobacterium sp. J49]|uniref:DUF2059 domain-containing protein n=1 Tax=Flavobacterium sp. J49 TaxID=2718534 RepID=UPI001594829D|nr:DUF2059 domain-containing protein [Flavobacterium sp. J49]MBF6641936.1 DUF2059 domain-containing protein [Flavobacterium sp. J49]NIC03183.1 DUF2059 domain-containing protein [Flavobacterium sp. J49]